jgi:hypothetical protein
MARGKRLDTDERDSLIAKLRLDIYLTRSALIGLMPKELQDALSAEVYCENLRDEDDWREWAIRRTIDLADVGPRLQFGDRAGLFRNCYPPCKEGARPPNPEGYAVPLALERHLSGTQRAIRCKVFSSAEEMALERARDNARPQERRRVKLAARTQPTSPWKLLPEAGKPAYTATVIKLQQD